LEDVPTWLRPDAYAQCPAERRVTAHLYIDLDHLARYLWLNVWNISTIGPIKYVIYIIKENRTYDQVFGDMKEGNGDPSLVMFGEKITPNHHKLAREFVLLDNLYCNG
jgi:phospholipase C